MNGRAQYNILKQRVNKTHYRPIRYLLYGFITNISTHVMHKTQCITKQYRLLLHWTSHRTGQRISLDITPWRTTYITGHHTVEDNVYHWTSHHGGQRISLDISLDITPWRTTYITGHHTVEDNVYHWTSHRGGQRISLDITPWRTTYITGHHTMEDNVYHWTSHRTGQRISLDITLWRTTYITGHHTMQDNLYHWTSQRVCHCNKNINLLLFVILMCTLIFYRAFALLLFCKIKILQHRRINGIRH